MKAVLLGTGDPLGMPVPLCDCRYCRQGQERLRTGLLVETSEVSMVFDIGPDIRQQLLEVETGSVDAFFATHCHVDHFGGLPELHQLHTFTDKDVKLYGSGAVEEYIEGSFPWVNIDFHRLENSSERIRDAEVHSFKVEHAENMPMQGFAVEKDGKKIVYIPDLKKLPENQAYRDADIAFVDGMYLFKKHVEEDENHATGEKLKEEIEKINADKVVLVNSSEHFNQMTRKEEKQETRYTIGEDLQEYRP